MGLLSTNRRATCDCIYAGNRVGLAGKRSVQRIQDNYNATRTRPICGDSACRMELRCTTKAKLMAGRSVVEIIRYIRTIKFNDFSLGETGKL